MSLVGEAAELRTVTTMVGVAARRMQSVVLIASGMVCVQRQAEPASSPRPMTGLAPGMRSAPMSARTAGLR